MASPIARFIEKATFGSRRQRDVVHALVLALTAVSRALIEVVVAASGVKAKEKNAIVHRAEQAVVAVTEGDAGDVGPCDRPARNQGEHRDAQRERGATPRGDTDCLRAHLLSLGASWVGAHAAAQQPVRMALIARALAGASSLSPARPSR